MPKHIFLFRPQKAWHDCKINARNSTMTHQSQIQSRLHQNLIWIQCLNTSYNLRRDANPFLSAFRIVSYYPDSSRLAYNLQWLSWTIATATLQTLYQLPSVPIALLRAGYSAPRSFIIFWTSPAAAEQIPLPPHTKIKCELNAHLYIWML